MSPENSHRNYSWRRALGFTLVELLVVIFIISLLLFLTVPMIRGLKQSGDLTNAANEVSGAISQARAYAIANNTYTWVGLFEENGAQNSSQPATAGIGRVVIESVASSDGTLPYSTTAPGAIMGSSLISIARLLKIDNAHLVTFPVTVGGTSVASPGPASNASIGNTTPGAQSLTPFSYPLGGTAQYTFTKAIQFSPRGEARINNSTSAYPMEPVIEIGLQSTHGAIIDSSSPNLVSIQVTGVGGDVSIYRK